MCIPIKTLYKFYLITGYWKIALDPETKQRAVVIQNNEKKLVVDSMHLSIF